MDLKTQRRMAADILNVGIERVWIDPQKISEVANAVTKDDIRKLIKEGVIKKKPEKGTSRHRARIRDIKRAKGRRRGHGRRKGKKTARYPRKERWMSLIRALRRELKVLRDTRKIKRSTYRKLYLLAKGGFFRSKAHLHAYIREHGLLRR